MPSPTWCLGLWRKPQTCWDPHMLLKQLQVLSTCGPKPQNSKTLNGVTDHSYEELLQAHVDMLQHRCDVTGTLHACVVEGSNAICREFCSSLESSFLIVNITIVYSFNALSSCEMNLAIQLPVNTLNLAENDKSILRFGVFWKLDKWQLCLIQLYPTMDPCTVLTVLVQ